MRNKVAKGLRGLATKGIATSYNIPEPQYKNFGTAEKPDYRPVTRTITMDKKCDRCFYKRLKRAYNVKR